MIPGWTLPESPFHAGEQAVQDRLGVRKALEARVRRAGIRNYLPEQHRLFFSELPFLLVGSLDANGQPWATLRVGQPGFITSPDPRTLHIAAAPLPHEPAGPIEEGDFVGALGIQFHTRRRNRVNGTIIAANEQSITLGVDQSYGNCNKYIQARTALPLDKTATAVSVLPDSDRLSDTDSDLIGRADTFFIATANLDKSAGIARGADVSHKGGRPRFIRVDDDRTLTVPDFTGNSFFNTIGNLSCNSRAGLLFIDFDSGDVLSVAASAQTLWQDPDIATFAGANRLLRFHIHRVHRRINALPLRWTPPQYAPELERTGVWHDTANEAHASLAGC